MLKRLTLLSLIFLCLFVSAKAQTVSKEASAKRGMGLVYLRSLEIDKAIESFTQSIELDENFTYAYYARGFSYWVKLEEIYDTHGRGYQDKTIVDKAIADYTKAIELKYDSADVYIALANLYLEKGDAAKAREILNTFLKSNLTKGLVYNNRGLLFAALGDFEKALKDFDTSIGLAEYKSLVVRTTTYRNRARLYAAMGNYDAAIADYTKQLELLKDSLSHSLRAWAFYKKGDDKRAVEDINLAVKNYPKSAIPFSTRGTIYLNQKEYDSALADYNQAIKLEPLNADYYRARAHVYRKMEQNDLAEADEAKAFELEQSQPETTPKQDDETPK